LVILELAMNRFTDWCWRQIARIVSRPDVARLLWKASTPYFDLYDKDGGLYMARRWVFNGWKERGDSGRDKRWPWLPSVRLHHICRPDNARDPHDHPWDARTIILHGYYIEQRDDGEHMRMQGDTAALKAGEFHNITAVGFGGVYTLFITWHWRKTWGFRKLTVMMRCTPGDRCLVVADNIESNRGAWIEVTNYLGVGLWGFKNASRPLLDEDGGTHIASERKGFRDCDLLPVPPELIDQLSEVLMSASGSTSPRRTVGEGGSRSTPRRHTPTE
jgi:hypothetical protein